MGGLKEAKGLKDSVKQDSTGAQLNKVENELLKRSNKAIRTILNPSWRQLRLVKISG